MKRSYCLLALARLCFAVSVYENITVSASTPGSISALSSTSRTATTTSQGHVGNYVAAGLGIEAHTSQSSGSSSSVPSTLQSTPFASHSVLSASAANSSIPTRTAVESTPFTTGGNFTTSAPSTAEEGYPDATGVITVNVNYSGDCWNRWNQFWNTSSTVSAFGLAVTKPRATATGLITSYRRDNLTIYGPACTLPSIVPSCASSWSSYQEGSIREAPPCSQASIGEKACNSVREDYLWNVKGVVMNPFFTNPGFLPNGSWPTHSSLAPSCTLGCAGCAITGNSVELLFWPEQTATPSSNGTGWQNNTSSPMTSDRGPVTAVVGTYTFTSPTVYISYDTLYAANSCGPIGDVYNNTILPLANTNHLSSLMLTAQNPGLFGPVYTYYYSASFNLSDLIEPVPQSVYNQAPACQSQSYKNCRVGGGECGFVCATDKPYAPIIAVPIELTDLHPEWKSCTPWYGGLYDPPIALTQAPTADVITPPGVGASPTTRPAAEAPPIQGMPPSVTAPPVQEPTTRMPLQPALTPDDEPESPRPPQNESPGSNGPGDDSPAGEQPDNNDPPNDDAPSNNQPGDGSSPPSPNGSPSNNSPGSPNPNADQPDLPVVVTQPTPPGGFIFNPEQSPSAGQDPPVNHGSPTNALEVLTQALNLGVGSGAAPSAAPNAHITPPPDSFALSPPDIPVSRSGSDYFVGTNQLPPGFATIVNGVEISNDPNANGVIIADSTTLSLAANQGTTLSVWLHGSGPLAITRPDSEHIVVAEHTLPQGEVATFRDVSVSVGPEGQVIVLGSSALLLEDGGHTTLPSPKPTAVGPEILRGPEAYAVGGVSVHAGEVVTVNGVAVSIGSGGEVVVDGKTTMSLGLGEKTAIPFWTASGPEGTRGESLTVVMDGKTFVDGEASVATHTDTSMASRASRTTSEMSRPGSATRAVDNEALTATETGAAVTLMAMTSGHLPTIFCGLLAMML